MVVKTTDGIVVCVGYFAYCMRFWSSLNTKTLNRCLIIYSRILTLIFVYTDNYLIW